MTATNHALTGAAVATVVRQPLLVVPLAFASHFICDALPHFKLPHALNRTIQWSYLYAEAVLMSVVAAILLSIGTSQSVVLLVVGAVVAMSPDAAWYYYAKRNIHNSPEKLDPFTRFHAKIQWSETSRGLIVELLWAACMISVILK